MNRFAWLTGLLVIGSASLGCVAPVTESGDGAENVGTEEAAIAGDGASTYFIVTGQDLRKCMYPICGGVYVKRLNQGTTKCADGVYRSECHATNVDLKGLGLEDADSSKFQDTFAQSYGIVRGSLKRVADGFGHDVDTLVATEAWVTATLSAPTGTFYGLSDNGIRCFAAPCSSILEEKLDTSTTLNIAEVDLTPSGANWKQIDQAQGMLSTTGILAAGSNHTIHGPGGTSKKLVASQFYTRLQPAAPTGVTCGANVCAEGEYCCNEGCGMCARIGMLCIQMTCN
jgi:hypothetical protein